MKDPGRLVHEHPSALARSLLNAAMDEEPPSTLLAETLKLTVGAAALGQTSASPAIGSSPSAPLATATATTTGVKGASLLVATAKWVGIASVGGVLTVSGVRAFEPNSVSPTGAPQSLHQSAPTPPPAAANAANAEAKPEEFPIRGAATEPVGQLGAEPTEPVRPLATTRVVRASAPSAAPTGSSLVLQLSEEAHVIDEARAAVARGDGSSALRILESHRKRFERPRLRPEALYLRMQALRLEGNLDAAARVATRLLEEYPNGPQSAAARALLNARER